MQFAIVSPLPELFTNWRSIGVTGRAFAQGLLGWRQANPRDYASDAWNSIDDTAYGGGAGMVLQLKPLMQALTELCNTMPSARVHLMAPEGRRFNSAHLPEWLDSDEHILVCGRYEGIDQRFIELVKPQIWSVGDMVLAGGELAAMSIIEAVARHIPGVLGNNESAAQDSFSHASGLLDYPHYTRPKKYNGLEVPPVLQSGNHARIAELRHAAQSIKTWNWRPDLLRGRLKDCDLGAINTTYALRLQEFFAPE